MFVVEFSVGLYREVDVVGWRSEESVELAYVVFGDQVGKGSLCSNLCHDGSIYSLEQKFWRSRRTLEWRTLQKRPIGEAGRQPWMLEGAKTTAARWTAGTTNRRSNRDQSYVWKTASLLNDWLELLETYGPTNVKKI